MDFVLDLLFEVLTECWWFWVLVAVIAAVLGLLWTLSRVA